MFIMYLLKIHLKTTDLFQEMKYPVLLLSVIVATTWTMEATALDITSLKYSFCNQMRAHWAYERLNLKYRCLEMVKKIGPKMCLDVILIIVLLKNHAKFKENCLTSLL